MKKPGLILLLSIIIVSLTGMAQATLINGDFETSDFTAWTVTIPTDGSASVVTSHVGNTSTYWPESGTYFAELKTDGEDHYTTISQSLSMVAGDKLEGRAAFDYGDWNPQGIHSDPPPKI